MMRVYCEACDCVCNSDGLCDAESISLDEDCQCRDYENYRKAKEWQIPFWKRMKDHNNNCDCRVMYYGKEIEIKGRKFFVESKSEYAYITDAITGYRCGKLAYAKDMIDRIIEKANEVEISLQELPIATYDEVKRVFTYEEKGGER